MIGWSTSDLAGLEFGDTYVAAARLRRQKDGTFVLTHAGWIDHGEATSPKGLAEAVRNLWKTSGIPTRMVCAALHSASSVMRYFAVPAMIEAELRNTLRLQAEEALQMTGDKLVVEWHALPRAANGMAPASLNGILVAAPRADVERELEILGYAGLDPVIVDMRALAVANLHAALEPGLENEPVCLVNVSAHAADIMVRQRAGRLYPHTVYCRASTWAESPGFLVDNVRDVLRYCEYKLGWDPASRLILTGDLPQGESLAEALAQSLKLPAARWDPVAGFRVKSRRVADMLSEGGGKAGLLAPALGLAMRRV